MRAVVLEAFDKKSLNVAIEDRAIPGLKPGQVLIEVAAAGVNPLDLMVARGEFKGLLPVKPPAVMGHELAGTVVESQDDRFAVGDEVYARPSEGHTGTFARYIVVPAQDVARKPRNLSMEQAAALPLTLLTAVQAFTEKSHVGPGTKVFIQGGTGGLGSVAIQVAKYLGATVATTVSTANVQAARELGADIVVDYRTQRYEDFVSGFDVVLDTLGGEETLRSMQVLRPGGTLVTVVGKPDKFLARQLGKPFLAPIMQLMSRAERAAAKKLGVNYEFLFMRAHGEQLAQYAEVIEAGHISPLVGQTFPLEQAREALELVGSGKGNAGKTVLTVTGTA